MPDLAAETLGCVEEMVCPNTLRAAAEAPGDLDVAKQVASAQCGSATPHPR